MPQQDNPLPMRYRMRPVTVGDLRQQAALSDADRAVIIVTDDKDLPPMKVTSVFPDTVDEHGNWRPVFKIKVERKPA